MNEKSLLLYLNRQIYIDILKVVAIILVIVRHLIGTTACGSSGTVKGIAIIFDSFTVVAVPIFFMCSGYVNLSKDYEINSFLKKRMSKIVIPFFLWSIFYYVWGHKINFISDKYSIKTFLVSFLSGNQSYGFLWFCYVIIGLYLVTPILRILIKNINKEIYTYLLILWFIFSGIAGLITALFKISIGFNVEIGLFSGYYLLGYYLAEYKINGKYEISFYIASIISFIIIALNFSKYTDYLFGDGCLFATLMSISLFLLAKNFKWVNLFTKIKTLPKIIYNVSTCTYGIYLSHYFFRDIVLDKINFHFTERNIIPMTFIIVLGILAVSFIITKTYSILKVTILKYVSKLKIKLNKVNTEASI